MQNEKRFGVFLAVGLACGIVGTMPAFAGDITMTSGHVSYLDGDTVRVMIENTNSPTQGGVNTPPCPVAIDIISAIGTVLMSTTIQAVPGSANTYDAALPATGGVLGAFAADMTITSSKLCSLKTLHGSVEADSAARAGNQYELQFRRSSKFN